MAKLSLVLLAGHKIASSTHWSPMSKQVIWTAYTTAFFSSAPLNQILSSSETSFDPKTDLTCQLPPLRLHTYLLIRLKTGDIHCDLVEIFPFPGHMCSPVAALKALKRKQEAAGLFSSLAPCFCFSTDAHQFQTSACISFWRTLVTPPAEIHSNKFCQFLFVKITCAFFFQSGRIWHLAANMK